MHSKNEYRKVLAICIRNRANEMFVKSLVFLNFEALIKSQHSHLHYAFQFTCIII